VKRLVADDRGRRQAFSVRARCSIVFPKGWDRRVHFPPRAGSEDRAPEGSRRFTLLSFQRPGPELGDEKGLRLAPEALGTELLTRFRSLEGAPIVE
jgi:hypothetical protein